MDMKVEDGKKISEKQSVNSNIKYSKIIAPSNRMTQ